MPEENKTNEQQNPSGGASPAQDPSKTTPAGVPQGRFDEIYRKYKSAEETNQYLQQEVSSLKSTIDEYVAKPQPNVSIQEKKELTDDEWNVWFQENPREALRWEGNKIATRERERATKQTVDVSFQTAQSKSREKIVTAHPDMYMKNTDGSIRRDLNNLPILDTSSEKVKVFNEVVQQNPGLGKVEGGPEMAMIQMEKILENKNIDPEKIKEEGIQEGIKVAQTAVKKTNDAFTAGSSTGVPEPKVTTNLSNEERRIASKLGVSDADYVANKGVERKAPGVKIDYS